MEVLFNNHIKFVLNLDTHTFIHIVSSLESGLKGLDTGISTQVRLKYSILSDEAILYNMFSEVDRLKLYWLLHYLG
jgi:hypothetical protein